MSDGVHQIPEATVLNERAEDQFDMTLAETAYDEYLRDGKRSRPITELFEEMDL